LKKPTKTRPPVVLGGEQNAPVTFQRLRVAAERGQLEAMYHLAHDCDDRSEGISPTDVGQLGFMNA
jgi:hypothetical protein